MSGGTFGTNWLDLSNAATTNLFVRSYVQGFVDISGGNLIVRNNNLYLTGGDASLNGRLFTSGDVSFNSRLYIGSDVSANGNLQVTKLLAVTGGETVQGDVSMNSRLYVNKDVSMNGNLQVTNTIYSGGYQVLTTQSNLAGTYAALTGATFTGDVSMNNRLVVVSDVSFNRRLQVAGDVSMNGNIQINGTHFGDVSLNSRLYVGADVSMNGNLQIRGNIISDVSMNNRLVVVSDVSFNRRLQVAGDVSMNGNIQINGTHFGDVSLNSRLYVGADVSMNGNLQIRGNIISDVSMNNRLVVASDVSFNRRLQVAGDVSMNGNIQIGGSLIIGASTIPQSAIIGGVGSSNFTTDVSMTNRLFVGSDVSFNTRLQVSGDVSLNGNVQITKLLTLTTGLQTTVSPNVSSASSAIWQNNNITWTESDSVGGNYNVFFNSTTDTTASIGWQSGAYSSTSPYAYNGSATTTVISSGSSSKSGLWAQIQSNVPVIMKNYSFIGPGYTQCLVGRIPGNYTIAGSNDGTTWYDLQDVSFTGLPSGTNSSTITPQTTSAINVSSLGSVTASTTVITNAVTSTFGYQANSYTYFRIIIKNSLAAGVSGLNNSGSASITQFEWQISFTTVTSTCLVTGGDVSMNGNVQIGGSLIIGASTIPQSAIIGGVGSSNFTTDVSMTNRLFVGSDVSLNKRLQVAGDASFNGNIQVTGYVLSSLFQIGNMPIVLSGQTTSATLSTLQVLSDASFNTRIFVGADSSFNGNVNVSKLLRSTSISENFITNTASTSPYTLDYSTGSIFYITSPPASNFTCNITNVPADINRTYVATLVIVSSTNKYICNALQINSNTAITPNYANGIPSTPLTSGNVITQTISIQRITAGDVAANVLVLSSVTPWY